MNSCKPMQSTSTKSLEPSNKSPSQSNSPRLSLLDLADKCRRTQGILTPTETLELLDIAECRYHNLQEARDEINSLEWDLTHPTSKDL